MSSKKTETDTVPWDDILRKAKSQGHLTVAELADLLPADSSVEQTTQLIERLQDAKIPVMERKPERPKRVEAQRLRAGHHKLLTRGEEVELAGRIRKGHRRRFRAVLRCPEAVDELILAARQVARGNRPVWDVLADFESKHPDEDEEKARERLAAVARDLKRNVEELKRLRNEDKRRARRKLKLRTSGLARRRRMANVRRAMAARLLRLDFQEKFIMRLEGPLLRRAAALRAAVDSLRGLEKQTGLNSGALGGLEPLEDRNMRRLLREHGLKGAELEQVKNRVKNAKRAIASNSRRARMDAEELLAAGKEALSGTHESNRARQRLVEANQRLVMSIARRYPHHSLDFLDLVQEGNLGLMRAADRFDPDLGYRFGTYAAWWVRQSIGRLLAEQGSAVRIPPHVQESLQKINRISRRISHKTGEQPDVDELAERLGKSPERIKEILSAGRRPVSTETRVGDSEDSATLLDFLPDPSAGPDEEADRRVQQAVLQDAMDALGEREKEIVMLRFHDGLTLQEVGQQFGITRERTRQLQEQALRKLRKRLKADLLRKLIQDQEAQRKEEARATRAAKPRRTRKKKKG